MATVVIPDDVLPKILACAQIGAEALDDDETLEMLGWTREEAEQVEATLSYLRRQVTS